MTKAWRNFARINGSDLGKKAISVFICPACGERYDVAPPVQCRCGGIAFDRFMSKGEANRWMQLRLIQRAGEISDLQRQVWFPLVTVTADGKPVKFADYVADFTYTEDGKTVIEDYKSRSGIDPVASLKLRIMEAAGKPVRLVTS